MTRQEEEDLREEALKALDDLTPMELEVVSVYLQALEAGDMELVHHLERLIRLPNGVEETRAYLRQLPRDRVRYLEGCKLFKCEK